MLEHQLPLALVEGRGPSGSQSPDHDGLDLRGGKARHGSPLGSALQHGLRDIVAVPARSLLGMGRGHGVAALVFDPANQKMLGGKLLAAAVVGVRGELCLHAVPGGLVEDRRMQALVDLALMRERPA